MARNESACRWAGDVWYEIVTLYEPCVLARNHSSHGRISRFRCERAMHSCLLIF